MSIDIDDSGAISETELFEAMDKLNMDFTEDQVREMIKTVDVNGMYKKRKTLTKLDKNRRR